MREEFKFKKSLLKAYVGLLKKSDYNKDGTVTLDEWMVWITQKKQEHVISSQEHVISSNFLVTDQESWENSGGVAFQPVVKSTPKKMTQGSVQEVQESTTLTGSAVTSDTSSKVTFNFRNEDLSNLKAVVRENLVSGNDRERAEANVLKDRFNISAIYNEYSEVRHLWFRSLYLYGLLYNTHSYH